MLRVRSPGLNLRELRQVSETLLCQVKLKQASEFVEITIPLPEDLMHKLGRDYCFSKIDLVNGMMRSEVGSQHSQEYYFRKDFLSETNPHQGKWRQRKRSFDGKSVFAQNIN